MSTNRSLVSALPALSALLCCIAVAAPARSGGSGGGSGGGGGSTPVTTTTTVPMNNAGRLFNGVLPTGRTTFTYDRSGATKVMTVQLENINAADGDTVDVEIDEEVRVANWIAHTYTSVHITITNGVGVATWNSATGASPPFMLPTQGTTNITIWGNYTMYPGTTALASGDWVESMSFGALTRG